MSERFKRGAQSSDDLRLSLVRKVSQEGWFQESAKRWVPQDPNALGLLAGAGNSCPGETKFCKSICYAKNSENGSGVRALVTANLALLREAEDIHAMKALLVDMISRYVAESQRIGIASNDHVFRIHWDGDFFSEDYARAWKMAMAEFPDVLFWVYTRSFVEPVDVVPELYGIPNLALYLSVDEYNVDAAYELRNGDFPDLRFAFCAEDYKRARALDRERAGIICPENIGRLALMENGMGACVTCGICPQARRDIYFSTSHVEDILHGQGELPITNFSQTPVEFIKKRRTEHPG
jgi:hypothetical protein